VAHAEASARTIEAAVATAAAQLGLRADQVDVEILEEPVPSTFGYIGSPARVRVTPSAGSGPGGAEAAGGRGRSAPEGAEGTTAPAQGSGPAAGSGSVTAAGVGSEPVSADAVGLESTPALATGSDSSLDRTGGPSAPTPSTASGSSLDPTGGAASTPVPSAGSDLSRSVGETGAPAPVSGSGPTPTSAAGLPSSSGSASDPPPAVDQPALVSPNAPDQSNRSHPPERADSPSTPGAGPAETVASDESASSAAARATGVAASPSAQPSSTTASGSNGDRGTERDSAATPSPRSASSTAPAPSSESPGTPRPSRWTNRDEPIDPAVVETDTERGGDFLEGLLDALDVDGDITTWVDEAGGHIDLEGSDLDALVGSSGETLDALQELTRLAVLRQSKRRVRLLLDINGFRARQRERLVSMVKATAEQVIRSREDHEFQPMTPAERKIVHDAVATIDGAKTESLGEDPHRRVVIRPA
jgi:spoIIIJ-associated protein